MMSFSLIRRAARGIKYSTIARLIDREITFSDRLAIATESTSLVHGLFPASSFLGPEQRYLDGQIAKYGLLDLRFSANESDLNNSRSGVPVLRELGLVESGLDYDDVELDDDDLFAPMAGVQMVLDDLDESLTYLKLFLQAKNRTRHDVSESVKLLQDPGLLQFPMTFTVTDACVTNVGSAWMMKHFYM